ncbi:MAG: arginine--tRNA ligase [Erysipelotrichaceae bacterium]
MTIADKLTDDLKLIIKNKYGEQASNNVMIEIPKDNNNGDYSTNIAMRLTKQLKTSPQSIAQELVEIFTQELEQVERIVIAGPGFINFWLKKGVIGDIISTVIKEGSNYGCNDSGQQQSVLVEYVSANPTGILHLGHARGAAWGDSLTRILKKCGYNCLREYYINDAGNQIDNLGLSAYARYAEYFNESVSIGADGYLGDDVKEIGRQIALKDGDVWLSKTEGRLEYFTEIAMALELKQIKEDLKYFRVDFDSWISENSLYANNLVKLAIDQMKAKDLTYHKDGALWLKTTNFGDDKDRVLIKADGSYTYFTPDIANHVDKFNRGYTKLINLWGADHHGYIARMSAALQALGFAADSLEVDIIQMVRLVEEGKEIKMSKRTGNAITIRELCDDIGVDAVRYYYVSRAVDTHMDFDLALARKQSNENPVFYVQYAHARICSILKQTSEFKEVESFDLLTHEKEIDLLKHITSFKDVVVDAAKTRQPNKITNYSHKLASYFHSYYNSCKVNDAENLDLTNQRIGLILASKITLANALDLIGVSAPEQM